MDVREPDSFHGRIVAVRGTVVDVRFEARVPPLQAALHCKTLVLTELIRNATIASGARQRPQER